MEDLICLLATVRTLNCVDYVTQGWNENAVSLSWKIYAHGYMVLVKTLMCIVEVCYDIMSTLKVKFIEVVFHDVLRSI